MMRCHFCAEWIDNDSEDCPNCRKNLLGIDAPPQTAPFVESSVDELIEGFRSATSGSAEQAHDQPSFPEPEIPSPLEEPVPETDLSTFRSQILDRKPLWERLPGLSRDREDQDVSITETSSPPVFRIALGIILTGIVAVVGVGIIRSVDFSSFASAADPTETSLPKPTSTKILLPTQTAAALQATSTLPPPTDEPVEANCVQWDEVTVENAGSRMCVFGEIRRWFAVADIPFVAIFSEEMGTFAFVDRTTVHSQVRPGMCIIGTGVIEVMSGTRPNIDLKGDLQFCPEP
jgi:hypothetical protein